MKTIFVNETNLTVVQQSAPACVMALGFFDGVHIGHQKVIAVAKAEAQRRGLPLALMSFRTHPINILSSGQRKIGNLMTLCTKQEKLAQLGIDLFYLVDFTKSLANLSPHDFVHHYLLNLGVKHAVAGFDYRYGKMGGGALLDIPLRANHAITVTEVACVHYNGEKISSTAIRGRLQHGLVHEIPHFLGHTYRSKAQLNKQQITILEDTMLPVPGQYDVMLIQNEHQVSVNVHVTSSGNLQCVQVPTLQGDMAIEWLTYHPLPQTTTTIQEVYS